MSRKIRRLSIPRATYLGGLPDARPGRHGNLRADATCIGVGTWRPAGGRTAWADVTEAAFTTETVGKNRAGAVLLFGILGLGAKAQKSQAVITVTRADGATALFQVDGMTSSALHAKMAPLLHALAVPVAG